MGHTTTRNRLVALTTATTLVLGGAVATAAPAAADIERHGRISGGGSYELSVDRERGGFEVDFELDDVRAGSRWVVRLLHDGNTFYRATRVARSDDGPRDGELDVERWRNNTSGADVFQVKLRKVGTTKVYTATIRTR